MGTILKVCFLIVVCLVASELQALAGQSFVPSQATHAALNSFRDASTDGGTWLFALERLWSANYITFMWFAILVLGVAMFWNEITCVARLSCSCCSSKEN